MFEDLSHKLDSVLGRFRKRGVLTEPMIDDGLRELRRVLLEADVNFRVAKDFLERVRERAVGAAAVKAVSPGQQIVKIVHDELAGLLGGEKVGIQWAQKPPTVILMVGLQGSGKTTSAAKLARRISKAGRSVMLAACDLQRPAAVEQLRTLGAQAGLPVFGPDGLSGTDAGSNGAGQRASEPAVWEGDPVKVAGAALEEARRQKKAVLIVDTAGRLQIDQPLMDELKRLSVAVEPNETLLVADAMTGQEAVRIAEGFEEALGLTGLVLTKMDGDARGGAALSIRSVTGKPIKYVGVGEGLDDLDEADPHRLAGRMLQMGDVVGLVERAERAVDTDEQQRLEAKVLGGGQFNLEDFLAAMKQVQRMGPIDQLVKLIPGMGKKLPVGAVDPKRMKHVEAIILSMTPDERRRPKILNGTRRSRIARGSGRPVSEVNKLLKQFGEMQKMMKRMGGLVPR